VVRSRHSVSGDPIRVRRHILRMQTMNPEALLAHDDFLRALARSLVFGSEDADDVVQEAFVAALRRPPTEGPTVRGYLAAIVRNVLRQKRRGDARRVAREERVARPDLVPGETEIRAREEERRRVVDAVFELEDEARETVLLRYFENLPPRRIAERLDVPVNTVKSRLRRAHAKLRERLDEGHRGDRKAWAALLLPLADANFKTTAVALTTTAKLALVGGLVAAIGSAILLSRPGNPDEPPVPQVPLPAEVAEAIPTAVHRQVGDSVLEGSVVRNGEPVAARVEVALLYETDVSSQGPGLGSYDHLFQDPGDEPVATWPTVASDGRFRVAALPAGVYEVRAVATDGARGTVSVIVPGSDETVTTVIRLGEARHILRGRAVHADGRAFRGRVGVLGKRLPLGARVKETNADGRFVFEDLPPEQVRLTALLSPDLRVWGPVVVIPSDGEAEFVVDGGMSVIPGRAVGATTEEGVTGVRILVSGAAFFARAVSGRDGSFRVAVPDEGGGALAEARGYGLLEHTIPPGARRLVLRLEPRAGISGRVTSEMDDRPVAGAVVRWVGPELLRQEEGRTTTDEGGRYELTEVPAGKVRVFVHGGGWVSPKVGSTSLGMGLDWGEAFEVIVPSGDSVRRDLVAVKTGSVEGRVLDTAGKAAVGIVVVAERDPFASVGFGLIRSEKDPERETDAEGRFAFDGLIPGVAVTIHARPTGGLPARSVKVVLAAGEHQRVELRLARPRTVGITVVDAVTGSPVSGAKVRVREKTLGREPGDYSIDLETDGAGRAVAKAAPPERLQINADHERYVKNMRHYRAEPGQEAVRIEMQPGHTISGRVTWPDGSPASKVFIGAFGLYPGAKYQVTVSARTDGDGAFSLERLPAGELTIRADLEREGKRFRVEATAEAGTSGLELRLVDSAGASRWLRVRVLDSDGRPVHRAWSLFYYRDDDASGGGSRLEDADRGDLKIRLPSEPFTGWLEIFRAEDDQRRPLPLGAVFLGPIRPGHDDVEVRLPPERSIDGRVVDETGKGVSGATVSARPAVPDGPKRPDDRVYLHDGVVNEPDGRYRLGRLADRSYRVIVLPPLQFARPMPRDAHAGTKALTFDLRASANPVLTVVDPEGRPQSGARVRVTEPMSSGMEIPKFSENAVAAGKTDGSGRIRLRGLDASARYRLEVSAPNDRRDLVGKVMREWQPNEEKIVLQTR